MKSCWELPAGYVPILQIDLQKNKKLAILVNGLAILIAVPLVLLGHALVPFTALFDMSQGLGAYSLRFAVLLGGMIVYMVLHELVHGIFIRYYSGKRARYGFTGMYAYAGSEAYFAKRPYLVIALAPVVVWGIVLAVITPLVPTEWFWVVYLLQVGNLAGAAGDSYVTVKFSRLPPDILVQDVGVSMTVYAKEE